MLNGAFGRGDGVMCNDSLVCENEKCTLQRGTDTYKVQTNPPDVRRFRCSVWPYLDIEPSLSHFLHFFLKKLMLLSSQEARLVLSETFDENFHISYFLCSNRKGIGFKNI